MKKENITIQEKQGNRYGRRDKVRKNGAKTTKEGGGEMRNPEKEIKEKTRKARE